MRRIELLMVGRIVVDGSRWNHRVRLLQREYWKIGSDCCADCCAKGRGRLSVVDI